MGKIESVSRANKTRQSQDRFQALLGTHERMVFKVANAYCGHTDERQDLIQEISFQLWRAFPGYDEQRPFSTWMYRIALNVGISFARRAAHRQGRLIPLSKETEHLARPTPSATDQGEDDAEFLHRFIAGLDELNRALVLLYLDEKSYAEIAEILGISETNVGTKIGRLKQRMRDASKKENL